jgi:hypothetical protein
MDIAEFRSLGFLQEVNRQFLHPRGLALEVVVADDGTESLGGIWDYRDDAEGVLYLGQDLDPEKAATVQAEYERHVEERTKLLGSPIQRVGP